MVTISTIQKRVKYFQSDESDFGEFPWVVEILEISDTGVSAGSLIHPKVVLTVFHHVKR